MAFVPTLQYQQTEKVLLQKRAAGEIDEIEYRRLLDDLITQEVRGQQTTVLDLAIQEMREAAARSLQEREQKQKATQEETERAESAATLAQKRQDRLKEGKNSDNDRPDGTIASASFLAKLSF